MKDRQKMMDFAQAIEDQVSGDSRFRDFLYELRHLADNASGYEIAILLEAARKCLK